MLKDFFHGRVVCRAINPDEAVAYGATAHSAGYYSTHDLPETPDGSGSNQSTIAANDNENDKMMEFIRKVLPSILPAVLGLK